jgi:hypothetical protein
MHITWVHASLAVVMLLLAGLAPATGRAQSPLPAPDLRQALAIAPITASTVSFTDWALLKQYKGASGLTSTSSAQDRLRFILSLTKDQAEASAYGINYFVGHAAAWGWDSTDLLWETNFQTASGSPTYVLRFRDDFDFAPVVAHFIKHGFTGNDYHAVPIYSHKVDFNAGWTTSTDLAILNTAVLATKRTLVLSASAASVRSVLDVVRGVAPALTGDRSTPATISRLGTMAAAMILPGAGACSADLSSTTLLAKGDKHSVTGTLLKELHPYAELGIGYRDEGGRPVGLVVMHFLNAGEAKADLVPRRSLAQNGISTMTHRPYRDVLFTVASAAVAGSDLVMQLRPVGNQPQHLFQMVDARDMLFAACP